MTLCFPNNTSISHDEISLRATPNFSHVNPGFSYTVSSFSYIEVFRLDYYIDRNRYTRSFQHAPMSYPTNSSTTHSRSMRIQSLNWCCFLKGVYWSPLCHCSMNISSQCHTHCLAPRQIMCPELVSALPRSFPVLLSPDRPTPLRLHPFPPLLLPPPCSHPPLPPVSFPPNYRLPLIPSYTTLTHAFVL